MAQAFANLSLRGYDSVMTLTREQVVAGFMALPPAQRLEVAEEIWRSAVGEVPADVEAAWMAECRERIARIDRGEAVLIPGDQVMRELREELRQRRSR